MLFTAPWTWFLTLRRRGGRAAQKAGLDLSGEDCYAAFHLYCYLSVAHACVRRRRTVTL